MRSEYPATAEVVLGVARFPLFLSEVSCWEASVWEAWPRRLCQARAPFASRCQAEGESWERGSAVLSHSGLGWPTHPSLSALNSEGMGPSQRAFPRL